MVTFGCDLWSPCCCIDNVGCDPCDKESVSEREGCDLCFGKYCGKDAADNGRWAASGGCRISPEEEMESADTFGGEGPLPDAYRGLESCWISPEEELESADKLGGEGMLPGTYRDLTRLGCDPCGERRCCLDSVGCPPCWMSAEKEIESADIFGGAGPLSGMCSGKDMLGRAGRCENRGRLLKVGCNPRSSASTGCGISPTEEVESADRCGGVQIPRAGKPFVITTAGARSLAPSAYLANDVEESLMP